MDKAIEILEKRIDLQGLVNLDEKLKSMNEIVKKKREEFQNEKNENIATVNKSFSEIYQRLDERKAELMRIIN